jgi:hypothetical protein
LSLKSEKQIWSQNSKHAIRRGKKMIDRMIA